MKGLLLKDLYTLGKQMKIFLVLLVAFALIPGYSMSAFAVMYEAMLPMTALAYDERSKWDTLAAMMPYSTGALVLSKYLLGYFLAFCAALIALAAQVALSLFQHTSVDLDALVALLAVLCSAYLLLAINMPLLFKLGVERGRLAFLILTVVTVLTVIAGADKLLNLRVPNATFLWIAGGCLVCIVIVNALSVLLSIKFYRTRLN